MSSTRYAKFPLDCEALKKANEAVWDEFPELKGRKLTMDPSDYKYRKVWMDAYIKAAGKDSVQKKKPKRKPGDPVTTCQSKPVPLDQTGNLGIEIVDEKGKAVAGANYRLTGPAARSGTVDSGGTANLEKLPKGDYRVFAWAKTYTEESETTVVIAQTTWSVTVRLKRQIPGNLPVRVRDNYNRAIKGVEVFLKGVRSDVGNPLHEQRSKKTPGDGIVVFESLRYGTYDVYGRKGETNTGKKQGTVKGVGVATRVELKWVPPNIWLGLGESHSGDLVILGAYNWNGMVYRLGADSLDDVEWAGLSASGLKLGGGLGGGVEAIAIFAHGINSASQFKQASKWSDMDFDLSLGVKLSGALKGLKGIGKVVKTLDQYKELSWTATQLYKNKDLQKPGVYSIPIPFAGAGLHVWVGRKYGGIDLVNYGKGL